MASSRKEEERNEKIIRGLMKLPPNRRCINCNSLGPQYVCPNFWTFVCITCSGIHREFTHRVKSVSMSKFASQEVDALQNGGNQRARDIYLKDWDLQRQRLPDSSNVDKIREFIRSVYVDRKYAGGITSQKPPRDLQNNRYREDETRRASSYHSYSQSPPYDNQYEDRRYGKQAATLTRKPGSDRGRYEGKMSSFVYSAGRLSEQMFEDRFANDGSGSRVSDYSVSSGGDASRSGVQSPNFPKDIGSSSPSFQPSWDNINEVTQQEKSTRLEENANRGAEGITFPQRTLSSGSFGSMDSYSLSLKSDVDSVSGQIAGTLLDKSTSLSSLFGTSDSLDLFKAPVKPEASSSLSIDSSHLTVHDPPQAFTPLELFADFPQHPSTKKQVQQCIPKNEGWATFDSPQPPVTISVVENENIIPGNVASDEGGSVGSFDLLSSSNTAMQWPSVPFSGSPKASSNISNPWSDSLHDFTAPNTSTSTQPWNAFEDTIGQFPLEETKKVNEQVASDNLLSTGDLYLGVGISENTGEDWTQGAPHGDFRDPLPSHVLWPSFTPQDLPQMGEMKSHAADHKSNNPFDIPYDTDLEQTNSCLDMSSLRHSLPNAELEASFLGGVSQSWFPQNAINVIPYIPAVADGGLAYMAGQAQSSQLPNVSTQGPVASIGGNPFA